MTISWQTWQSVLSIIGAVGGLCGLWSLWYARRQTHLMEGQIRKQDTQDKEDLDWSQRFERLANQLARINPGLTIQEPGKNSTMGLYASIFSDPKFREALENYVVQVNPSRTQFAQRNPRPDELRRSNLRETVKRAEQCMTDFQKQNPRIDLKYYMG
jgi:hypothetical protein